MYEVTIGIPVYKAASFIRKTLESVLEQTYSNMEILLLDDCGDDGWVAIVNEIMKSHPRGNDIRIVSQPHNMGVSAARNRIIDEARGRYLYFLDSDDIITKDCIETLYKYAIDNNADAVYGSYVKIEADKSENYQYPFTVLTQADEMAHFAYRKYGGIQAPVWNILFELDFLKNTKLYFINTNYWEDLAFSFELVTYIKRAVLLPNITYKYLCRDNSLSHYQIREVIGKEEIERNVFVIDTLKQSTKRLLNKSYLDNRCYNLVMTDLYVVCNIIKNRQKIQPAISASEMKSYMVHPLSFEQILSLQSGKMKNLLLYIWSKLPSSLFIYMTKQFAKRKGLLY